jgi:hypothetical protein
MFLSVIVTCMNVTVDGSMTGFIALLHNSLLQFTNHIIHRLVSQSVTVSTSCCLAAAFSS